MKKTKIHGFTIVEVLVVVLLISLLAVLLVPKFIGSVPAAQRKIAKAQIATIEQLLSGFLMNCGRYPNQVEGLKALRTAPAGLTDKWKGPYGKESDLIDPWGNPFDYKNPGTKNPTSYDIISYGADGKPGGEGDSEDIYND